MDMAAELLTVGQVAERLKMTPQFVRQLINGGKLTASRVGKQWLILQDDLKRYIEAYNVSVEPDDHPRLTKELPEIVALSFFSGAMGLDIGMRNGGIKAILACENNKYCRMTIQKNEPEMALIGDINNYDADSILKMARIPEGRTVDVIFGGPPCQAFSTAGARRGLDDARGNVFLRYIDVIEKIRPKYVVIENVRGLLSAPYPYGQSEQPIKGGAMCVILDRLRSAGYTISFDLYNAANFGAPQIRERVVMIGKLDGEKVDYLTPTHEENGAYGLTPWRTLADAVQSLREEDMHYIPFPEKRLKFYRMLTEGQYWKNLPESAQREAMGAKLQLGGGKTGFYRRLSFSRPSPTLVTNPTMPATDLCHPTMDRPLSIEEYACIQGFPAEWEICGPILEQYRQIGNAVPIKLGEAIAKTILADMRGDRLQKIEGYAYSRYKNTSDMTWCAHMRHQLDKISESCKEKLEVGDQMAIAGGDFF